MGNMWQADLSVGVWPQTEVCRCLGLACAAWQTSGLCEESVKGGWKHRVSGEVSIASVPVPCSLANVRPLCDRKGQRDGKVGRDREPGEGRD